MKLYIILFFIFLGIFGNASVNSCLGFYRSDREIIFEALVESAKRSELGPDFQSLADISKVTQLLFEKFEKGKLSEYQIEQIALKLIARNQNHIPWKSRLARYFKSTTEESIRRSNFQAAVFTVSLKQILGEFYSIRALRQDQRVGLFLKKTSLVGATIETSLLVLYLKYFGLYAFMTGAPLPGLKVSSVSAKLDAAVERAFEVGFEAAYQELIQGSSSPIPRMESFYSTFRRRYQVVALILTLAILPKDAETYKQLWNMIYPSVESSAKYPEGSRLDPPAENKL